MGKQETAERQFAQALVKQLHEEHTRLHGKEMGVIPVQLVFAAKHTIEELLRQVTVLETEAALRADAAPQPQASLNEPSGNSGQLPQPQGEPVAWQTRYKMRNGQWSDWQTRMNNDDAKSNLEFYASRNTEAQVRGLYPIPGAENE